MSGRRGRNGWPCGCAARITRSGTPVTGCMSGCCRHPRARTTGSCSTERRCRILAHAGSLEASAVPRACSTRVSSIGVIITGPESRSRISCCTSCTWARSPRRARSSAVIPHLRELRKLGVTAIELMPVAEFPGQRGWGYDGVQISAAFSGYGGPKGCSDSSTRRTSRGSASSWTSSTTTWGLRASRRWRPSGRTSPTSTRPRGARRSTMTTNGATPCVNGCCRVPRAGCGDFHLDGLRLDAIHAIHDDSARPILRELATRVHALDPRALVIAESGLNDPKVIRPADVGGHGHDAQWADDFHHALRVLLTGDHDGYYADFGAVFDLAKAFRRPFVHDGTYSRLSAAALRSARRRSGTGAVRRLLPEPRPGGQSRPRRSAAGPGAAAGSLLRPAVAVHAYALHGRGVRRASAVPVLHRSHRCRDRAGHERGPTAGVRALRRLRRGVARSAGT